MRQPAVYLLASAPRATLYVGVTGWLRHGMLEHRESLVDGFTKRCGLKALVWFELAPDSESAIRREKQIKKWNRALKLELIEKSNPTWRDLGPDILD